MNSKRIDSLTVKEIKNLNYFTKAELRDLNKRQLINKLKAQLISNKDQTVGNLKFIKDRESKLEGKTTAEILGIDSTYNSKGRTTAEILGIDLTSKPKIKKSIKKHKIYKEVMQVYNDGGSIEVDVSKSRSLQALEEAINEICSNNMNNKKIVITAIDEAGNKRYKTLNDITKVNSDNIINSLVGKINLVELDSNTAIDYDNDGFFYAVSIKLTVIDSTKTNKQKYLDKKANDLGFDELEDIDLNMDESNTYNLRSGAFWGWLNLSGLDLSCYQIFNELKAKNYKDNCFVWACKQSGIFNDQDIEALIQFMKTRQIPLKKIKEIADAFQVHIKINVVYENSNNKLIEYGKQYNAKQLKLLLMNNHFMLDKPVSVSTCYLKNKQMIDERYSDVDFNKRCQVKDLHSDGSVHHYYNESHTTPLSKVLKIMFENNLFEPIKNMEEINRLGCEYQNKLAEYTTLDYSETACLRVINKETKCMNFNGGVYYADFETDPTTNPHTPYLFITTFGNSFRSINEYEPNEMSTRILELYPDNSLIYFHNLKYDISFLINNNQARDVKIIKRTGTVIQVVLKFKKKTLTFRDSLCIIPAKLASFGSMFNLKVHKEVMAYKLYTKVNRDRRVIPIQEYYDQLDIENCYKSEEERANLKQQLLDNAMRVNRIYKCVCYDADNSTIDIMQYAKFYCLLDVKVLKEGMNQFEHDIAQVFTEYDMLFYGIHNYLSISSLGYSLAKTYGCFDECFELSGKPQHFISRAVNGGRTMTAENKKQLVTDSKIQDFDAVSLYPSAMYLMPGIPKGKPKVLTTELINEIYENPNTNSLTDYFIEINIIDIACKSDRDYKFGLLWKQNEKGSKLYGNECVSNRVISKTELLDLLEFYDCSYEIIRGYYFDEGYNTLIKEFIKKLFDLRASYKKQGNPLEKTVKLLLNSIYGKSILKPIDCETKCIHENRLEKFIYRHYNYIKSMEQSENSSNVYIKYIKSINRHFNFPQFGVNVLAYSKHLMNTVMCTAEQANIDIYYQDTDSIHIKEEDLPLLADRFNEKYNRELIGSNLGQFHSDFDSIASSDQIKEAASQGIKYQVWSKKLIALGKKSYLDILEDNLGNIGYHARMKGVPNQCLTIKCQELGITLEELYMNLYNGNEVEFDLLKGCAGFKLTNTFEQYTRDNFSRKLRF